MWLVLLIILLLSGCGLLQNSQVGLDRQITVGEKIRPHKAQTNLISLYLDELGRINRQSDATLQPNKIVVVEAIGGTQIAANKFAVSEENLLVIAQWQSPREKMYFLIDKERYLRIRWWK